MCGIAGVFGKPDPTTVDRMLARLAHRGPDDHFLVSGRAFTLGARRLAIIDVEGGRQPLSNEMGSIWACQNGELYNFKEIRSELESSGHTFRTSSDTEILPHLYEERGADFPRALRGMFAVAVWDDATGRGILARDHTGKKPLYYLQQNGCLYFASEIKSLLEVPGYERRLNAPAVHHYLSYKHVPGPDTAFVGIRELPAAHTLSWSSEQESEVQSFWKLSWAPRGDGTRMDEEEIVEELLRVLTEAVRLRLVSDVPIGFYLSGGVDSSLSTAIAASVSSGPIVTFTLAYDEKSTTPGKESDRFWARSVAELYGTDHHEEVLRLESFANELPDILYHFDQPFSGVVSSYFLSRLISRHVKVALSGDGADELFGSYLSHRLAPAIAAYVACGSEEALPEEIRPLYRAHREVISRVADPDPAIWRARLFVFSEEEKRRLYTPEFSRLVGEASTEKHLRRYFEEATAADPLNRILEAEFRGIFPDQVLAFVDRLSMAHSLETRTAYLDREFVELAASLPGALKIRGVECKYILKRAARRYLPEELVNRGKEGFVMPVNQWLSASLSRFTTDVLAENRVESAGMLRPSEVSALVSRFTAGETALANQVLSLLALQIWWETYFGRHV